MSFLECKTVPNFFGDRTRAYCNHHQSVCVYVCVYVELPGG